MENEKVEKNEKDEHRCKIIDKIIINSKTIKAKLFPRILETFPNYSVGYPQSQNIIQVSPEVACATALFEHMTDLDSNSIATQNVKA